MGTLTAHDSELTGLSIDIVTPYLPGTGSAGHLRYLASITDALLAARAELRFVLVDSWPSRVMQTVAEGIRVVGPGVVQRGRRVAVVAPRHLAANVAASVVDAAPPTIANTMFSARSRIRRRTGVDQTLFRPLRPATVTWLADLLDRDPGRLLLINGHGLGAEAVPTDAPVCFITHDSIAARCASMHNAGFRTSPAEFGDDDERRLLARARLVTAIQLDDVERFRSLCPAADVVWLPPSFPASCAPPAERTGRPTCLFVGSASLPNVAGLTWFLDEVWPIVATRRSDAVIRVIGSVGDRVRARPGVEVVGRVQELEAEYNRAHVCVVPLRVGSGLKIKTVEAIAHHVPTVTTTVGAEGLPLDARSALLVTDDAAGFAAAVVQLLNDEVSRAVLQSAAALAAPCFDPATFAIPFLSALRRVPAITASGNA